MARDVILEAVLEGEPVSADDLKTIPGFDKINAKKHEQYPGAIVRRTFPAEFRIIRQGEHGTTAFYIISGSAEIFVNVPGAQVRTPPPKPNGGWGGNLLRFTDYLKGVPARRAQAGSVVQTEDPPLGTLAGRVGPGDIVGELETLNKLKEENRSRPKFYPRGATVRAVTEVVVLEMLPNYLNNAVFTTAPFKERLNESYNRRAIEYTIRSAPVFRSLSEELLADLCAKAELVNFKPGDTICKREDKVEFFDLIRLGFVKLSEAFPGGELVLAYLSRNSHFGEVGLVPSLKVRAQTGDAARRAECLVSLMPVNVARARTSPDDLVIPWDDYISRDNHAELIAEGNMVQVTQRNGKNPIRFRGKELSTALVAPGETFVLGQTTFAVEAEALAGRHPATCTATDYVQLVRIKAEYFPRILQSSADARAAIDSVARGRRQLEAQLLRRIHPVSMDDFINQDLMQGQDVLMLDLDRCTRCDECVKACVATHTDGVTRLMRDGIRFQNYLVTTSCRACLDPLCMTHCPVGSIRRKGSSLDIVIEDWCTGCNACANDCPYGAINIVDMTHKPGYVVAANGSSKPKPKAVVCDLCREYPEPNCVRACPQDAAIRVQPNFFFARDLAGVQLAAIPKPTTQAVAEVLNETRIFSNMDLLSLTPRLKVLDATAGGTDPLPAGASRTFLLRIDGATSFGRSAENNWVLENSSVSGKHAVIECRDSRFVLRNLSKTNGTYVNNDLAELEVELHPGDLIEMGVIKFKFLVGRP